MPVKKRLLKANRLRRIPKTGFSWIDRRFVRNGHLQALPQEAITLYFFLVAVADADGVSFYADPTITKLLKLPHSDLLYARDTLIKADLIAYRYPLYQVLALPESRVVSQEKKPRTVTSVHRSLVTIGSDVDQVLAQLRARTDGRRGKLSRTID